MKSHASDNLGDDRLARVAEQAWDTVVVGAGPAGSVVARQLALRGKRVLLVEKAIFPRRKVCGGCLNAAGIAALERLGLTNVLARIQAEPVNVVSLRCGGTSTEICLTDNVAIARDRFDSALAEEAVAAGATFITGVEAKPDGYGNDCRWVQLSHAGQTARVAARIVIVAAGLNGWREPDAENRRSPVADSRVGVGTILDKSPEYLESGKIYMSVAPGGYVGMVRLAGGALDVAAAFDKKFLAGAGGPAAAAALVLEKAGLNCPSGFSEATWYGTPALTHHLRHVATARTFFIGDAAGYVEPFTGEGMAWALQSAYEVTQLADRAIAGYTESISAEWDALHRRLLARRMLVCGAVGRLLRHPRLARVAVSVLARAPWLAAPIVRSINRSQSMAVK